MYQETYFYCTLANPAVWELVSIPAEHAPFWNFVEAEHAQVVEHYDYLSMWYDYIEGLLPPKPLASLDESYERVTRDYAP